MTVFEYAQEERSCLCTLGRPATGSNRPRRRSCPPDLRGPSRWPLPGVSAPTSAGSQASSPGRPTRAAAIRCQSANQGRRYPKRDARHRALRHWRPGTRAQRPETGRSRQRRPLEPSPSAWATHPAGQPPTEQSPHAMDRQGTRAGQTPHPDF